MEAQVDMQDGERDSIFMIAGLNFLVLENFRDASKLKVGYKIKMDGIEGSEPAKPAVLLIWMMEICQREQAGKLYQWLVQQFGDLQRLNTSIPSLLQRIGKIYFGLKPPPNMMSMLENMLGGGGVGMGEGGG